VSHRSEAEAKANDEADSKAEIEVTIMMPRPFATRMRA